LEEGLCFLVDLSVFFYLGLNFELFFGFGVGWVWWVSCDSLKFLLKSEVLKGLRCINYGTYGGNLESFFCFLFWVVFKIKK
jgi:hypothetical protein